MQEKVRKLFESRSKAEDELRKIQQKVDDAGCVWNYTCLVTVRKTSSVPWLF